MNPMINALMGRIGTNNPMQLIGQLKQFMSSYKGDPRSQVQQMLNSGAITQSQYDQAVQMANSLSQMMGMK